MDKVVKISVVSYLNSKPFIYGIQGSKQLKNFSLELDTPAICASKLLTGKVEIGLVPVAVIPDMKYYEILTEYCIGAEGAVDSVELYSEVPLEKIEKIVLDYQSKTSVTLVQVLTKKFWKIKPQFIPAEKGFENKIGANTAAVVIGDRTFALKNKFRFTYDLAGEWKKFTGLPFVFACWVGNKELPYEFVSAFNEAVKSGIENREDIVEELQAHYPLADVSDYLMKKISYRLDDRKKQALKLFLGYMEELKNEKK